MAKKRPKHRKAVDARVSNAKIGWSQSEETMFKRIMKEAASAGEGYEKASKVLGRTPVALQIKWSKLQRAKSTKPKHKPRATRKGQQVTDPTSVMLNIKDIQVDFEAKTLVIFF